MTEKATLFSDHPLALGLDLGTSGARAAAVTEQGHAIAHAAVPLASPGNQPEHWWRACRSALEAVCQQIAAERVVAVAVDGTSGTLLAVDAEGVPIGEGLLYHESSVDPSLQQRMQQYLPGDRPVASATSGLAKAMRLLARPRASLAIHQADWILGQLCGDYGYSDETNALKTGYDPVTRRWPEWLAAFDLNQTQLPSVVPVGTTIGALRPDLAQSLGLSAETLVVAGTTDGCASFLATGASEIGDAVTALGSTLTLKQLVAAPVFDAAAGVYTHRIGDQWLAGGASNTGGAVLAHYFAPEQLEQLSQRIDPEHDTGLNYYPLLRPGERFPINDQYLKPRLDPRPAEDHRFLHGLLEGIATIEKTGYRRLETLTGSPLRSVRTVGGGARNATWTRLRARLCGVPFLPADSTEAAVGTARLAWQGYRRRQA